ncbi:energy-coupling factor transporter ATPase [Mitsuokella sp.]|uniref:energy-coupling factor transporter ATPase n=1 Tax=Mitsuokella sp. TaxID=2049034 RepID=UPI003D7CD9E4
MAITLEHVDYIYMPKTPFAHQALKDVSLTIEEGSFTAIAGHTGSGKSTLLQQFNGLLQPTSGRVLVDGVDINPKNKKERASAKRMRLKVGMVFQYAEQQLFEETIAADIAFGPRNLGLAEDEVEARVREAMQLVHLDYETYKERSPFELSGGQQRRVAIAGVLALQPEYLVLDEPTAGLDPRGREELIRTIRYLHEKKNVTIIFVSHNMDDIARLADHVIIMSQAEKIADASPKEVFKDTAVLTQAGLRPPHVMELLARMKEAGLPVRTDCLNFEEAHKCLKDVCRRLLQDRKDYTGHPESRSSSDKNGKGAC